MKKKWLHSQIDKWFQRKPCNNLAIQPCKHGFTLIELLIVVAIIGILSALLMANFIGIRGRARDGSRKADLRQIQTSLELYRADLASYPTTNPFGSCGVSFPASGSTIYMQKVPCDPLGSGYNGGKYYYVSDGRTYTVAACLENASDPQGTKTPGGSIDTDSCTTKNADNSTGFYYVLTNP